jgi:hypothetical protein
VRGTALRHATAGGVKHRRALLVAAAALPADPHRLIDRLADELTVAIGDCGEPTVWTWYSWGDTPVATEGAARELKRRGLAVETEMYPDGRIGIRYRHRDGRRVVRTLSQLGVRPPHVW